MCEVLDKSAVEFVLVQFSGLFVFDRASSCTRIGCEEEARNRTEVAAVVVVDEVSGVRLAACVECLGASSVDESASTVELLISKES